MTRAPIEVSREVRRALDRGDPVVALESAVVTHGLPAPANLASARQMMGAVDRAGAVAAMIAVVRGRIRVGLGEDEIAALARDGGLKVARRDLPAAVATGATGGTTVSATLAIAHAAGLSVQATGGIGGVHLGAERSWDVSADLDELARRPLVVVSSGAKAICDPGTTLEALETRGIPVVGYRTDRFPLFYVEDSGYRLTWRVTSPAEVVATFRAQRTLGDPSALLVANPPPAAAALPAAPVQDVVREAVRRAEAASVRGSDLTPFLLAEIDRLTGGRAVPANLALLEANAALAAEIAVALATFALLR